MNAAQITAADQIEKARKLGALHGVEWHMAYAPADDADIPAGYDPWTPDGYTSYVYWDAGSARLMDELGERGEPADAAGWYARGEMVRAYCEAFASATGTPFDTSC